MTERRSVPITVIVPERHDTALLRRCSADPHTLLLASGEALAAAGLLGQLRAGRAMVIKPDVASRTPGCECCQVRLDLIDAVRHAVLRRSPPRRLVVIVDRAATAPGGDPACSDPLADVVTVISTLHADGEIERLAHLGGLVVEVDAVAAATRLASGDVLWDEQIEAALAIADSIVVTGADLVTDGARSAIISELRSLNLIGSIVVGDAADVDLGQLVDLDAWRPPPAASGPRDAGAFEPHDWPMGSSRHSEASVQTVVLRRPGVLDPDATNDWLDRVIAESPRRLFRFQAALRVSMLEARVCVRGSRSTMTSDPEVEWARTVPAGRVGDGDSVVVLVGRDLDRDALSESFDSIEATP